MPSLELDYRTYDSETSRLLSLCSTLESLSAHHQKLVAEIALLRLFSLFENLVASTCAKVASGAKYLDGTAPFLRVSAARSRQNALALFRTHGRSNPRSQLRWTKASEIKKNVRFVIDCTDNMVRVIDQNGSLIDEIRRVRNRVAHNNSRSRENYRQVVRKHYGAYLNHVTPGMLLLAPRISPCLLVQYISKTRIVAKDIVKKQ